MIELVVFDIAGTTVHDGDAVNASFRQALARWDLEVESALVDSVMGLPKPEAIRILLDSRGGDRVPPTPETIESIHQDFTERMRTYYATSPDVREIPGATDTFAKLRSRGIRIALDTGFFRPIAQALLDRLGWTESDTVDAIVTSDEVARGRPYPDMIQHLMSRLGVADASRVAKVGDTRVDLEEGTNAGCALVIGVTTGSYTRKQLLEHPHTHIVESIVDVPALLDDAN